MNVVRVQSLLHGFTSSARRFDSAHGANDAGAMFHALFEALNWAVAIDDRIREDWAPEGKVLGFAWRDRVPGGSLLAPVRWVRNTVHHDWADALELRESGLTFPLTFPMTFQEWVWREAKELPSTGGRRGRSAYEREMAGTPASETLQKLEEAFVRVITFLDPPRPKRGDRDAPPERWP